MKKQILIGLFSLAVLAACRNGKTEQSSTQKAAASDTLNYTNIQWLDSIVNFGTINMGEKIQIKFRCKNTGDKPLIITNARPGCGCTVADYTKQPIPPNGEGLITASFDSQKAHSTGEVRKTIVVTTNTKNNTEHYLFFTGDIKCNDCDVNNNGNNVAVPHEPVKN
ncbi:DUF1573 domain-containing protein [Chitinophagaceae bacterium LWZ2-11]